MNEKLNMAHVFDKLDDLKSVFTYGQKIIPTLQGLIEFMGEIIPLLQTVNASIAESTNQMPKASNHISDVTNATELATTEILDTVDTTLSTLENIKQKLEEQTKLEAKKEEIIGNLKKEVEGNTKALNLLSEYDKYNHSSEKMNAISESLSSINDNLFNITLSLQVQDITSQQLAAVNHLIESVQVKLASLMDDIDGADLKKDLPKLKIDAPRDGAFNPDAKYTKSTDDQDLADSLIESQKNIASQDEIDKLFS
jgi:chemotaxis regulatin CheY-phosphate phosphatase CheZ